MGDCTCAGMSTKQVEGDRGAGVREYRGAGEGGERENRGREAGAEVKKAIQSFLFITGYHSVKNTYLAKFWNFYLTSTNA